MDGANHHNATTIVRSPLRWSVAVMLTFAAVTLVAFRYHAFDLPLETDEGNYAYIAARLLDGDTLYVDVWDHQPPGVFILFAGAIALFGDAPVVFRLIACATSVASMLLIFGIVRRLSRSPRLCATPAPQDSSRAAFAKDVRGEPSKTGLAVCWPALAAAFLFAIVSSDPGTAGEGCQREIYMNTLILAAWYLALRGAGAKSGLPARAQEVDTARARRTTLWCFALSGLCLALASLIKTVVAVHWFALAAWILVVSTRLATLDSRGLKHAARYTESVHAPKLPPRHTATGNALRLLSFACGPLLLWGGTFLYFAIMDRFAEFFDAVFRFNLGYSGSQSALTRVAGFFTPDRQPFIFDSAKPLWIAGALATFYVTFDAVFRRNRRSLNVLALSLACFVAVCLPGRFWPHYYYLLIPALVITVCYAAARFGEMHRRVVSRRAGSVVLLATVLITTLCTQYRDYLRQPPFGITVKRYNSRDFWGRGQGKRAQRVTDPSDTMFVYGNEASIYYYAKRRCASRYTMITGLEDGMPGAQDRRAILMDELRASPPRLILVLFDQQPFDEWKAFLHKHYGAPVGWDLHDKTRKPIMFVLARKDAPIEPIDWDWDRSSVGGWQLGDGPR